MWKAGSGSVAVRMPEDGLNQGLQFVDRNF